MEKALLLFIAVLFSVIVSAQVDFSGLWKLNTSKSTLGDQFSMAPKEIIVVQKGNEMSVEKHSEWHGQEFTIKDKFTLDGKECINAAMMESKKKSTAVWSSDNKTLKISSKIPMQDGGEFVVNEVYKIDDESMVIQSDASSSFGDMSETQVYDKK